MQTTELNMIYKWVRIALIVLVVFLTVLTLGKLKSLRDVAPAYNSVTVTGQGEAVAVPDVATFSFTISADAPSVSAAQEAVTKKVDAVLKALADLKIEEKDIKTSDYSVYPKYVYKQNICASGYCSGNQVQDGYTASHSVTVKVRDTEKAGQALAAAGDNGATNLSSLSFTVDDPDQVTTEARTLAIKDAREKAEALAKALGVRLVRVVGFYDSSEGGPLPMYREANMAGDAVMTQAKAPTVPTGENKTTVSVNVVYEIR
jgi:uncharacterized protein YggE